MRSYFKKSCFLQKEHVWGWRVSTCCIAEGQDSVCRARPDSIQDPVLSDLHRHQAHSWCTYTHAGMLCFCSWDVEERRGLLTGKMA